MRGYKIKTQKNKGFTLIELLLVLGITTLLLALSVTSWNRMIYQQEHNRFPFAFRWFLSEARQKAISENRTVRIFVEWENKTMEMAKAVTWLELPCSREGGPLSREVCPAENCLGANVASSSCVPLSRSERLLVPEAFRLPNAWGELCFLAGSGKISEDCRTEMEIPAGATRVQYMQLKMEGRYPYKFHINPISSYIELINCNNVDLTLEWEACLL